MPQADAKPKIKPTFIVRDGMLVSLGRPAGHIITDAQHENFRLDVEYRFAARPGNCGVLVHASTPRALYKMFPKSIEVQMNHRHAGDFWCIVQDITVPDMVKRRGPKKNWGIIEGKARRILNLTDDSEKPVGHWNAMKIECLADEVKVWVNGDLVNHGSKCTATKGQIALQAEGSEVEFRKLDITPISKLSTDPVATNRPKVKHLIDTHIHLFDPRRPQGIPWPPKSDKVLYKPHLRGDYRRAAKPVGVTAVVIVEASDWPADNRWVLDHVKGDDLFIGLVGQLDLTADDFTKQLDALRRDKRLVGLRLRPSGKWDPKSKKLIAGAKALAERKLSMDVLIGTVSVADCDYLARQVPSLTIIADHALSYRANGKTPSDAWIAGAKRLAENPNVYCKISGLYERSVKQPAPKDLSHYKAMLDILYGAFGPKRLIYGSNWPVTERSGSYASYVTLVDSYFAPKGQDVRELYYWKNAARAYRLPIK